MTLAHLVICTTLIYATFLIWALLQERLTTTPYALPIDLLHPTTQSRNEYFKSPLVLNALQAIASSLIAVVYLLIRSRGNRNESLETKLGIDALTVKGAERLRKQESNIKKNSKKGKLNGQLAHKTPILSPLLLRYVQIAASQSISSVLALKSLSHGISYPTLTLAKSCKLVPVLFANVLLYRRKFAAYKYVVVTLVTIGISMFMLFGKQKSGKVKPGQERSSFVGLLLLLGNQALDGITNSTQDQVFATYKLSGPKMMLIMNSISAVLMSSWLALPFIPFIVVDSQQSELSSALSFIKRHPEILQDMLGYAFAGALGQIAIFETLERFGSLTLVAITVTRKLFTMLLSVIVYKHALQPAQWFGVSIVFAGLFIEAREKQKEGLAKKVVEQKSRRASIKDA